MTKFSSKRKVWKQTKMIHLQYTLWVNRIKYTFCYLTFKNILNMKWIVNVLLMKDKKKTWCTLLRNPFVVLQWQRSWHSHVSDSTHTGRHLCIQLQPIMLPATYKIMNQVMNSSKEVLGDTDGPLFLDWKSHSNTKNAVSLKHFKTSGLAEAHTWTESLCCIMPIPMWPTVQDQLNAPWWVRP